MVFYPSVQSPTTLQFIQETILILFSLYRKKKLWRPTQTSFSIGHLHRIVSLLGNEPRKSDNRRRYNPDLIKPIEVRNTRQDHPQGRRHNTALHHTSSRTLSQQTVSQKNFFLRKQDAMKKGIFLSFREPKCQIARGNSALRCHTLFHYSSKH